MACGWRLSASATVAVTAGHGSSSLKRLSELLSLRMVGISPAKSAASWHSAQSAANLALPAAAPPRSAQAAGQPQGTSRSGSLSGYPQRLPVCEHSPVSRSLLWACIAC